MLWISVWLAPVCVRRIPEQEMPLGDLKNMFVYVVKMNLYVIVDKL